MKFTASVLRPILKMSIHMYSWKDSRNPHETCLGIASVMSLVTHQPKFLIFFILIGAFGHSALGFSVLQIAEYPRICGNFEISPSRWKASC